MEGKELRIGNYIKHSELHGITEVMAVGKDYIHILFNNETLYESIKWFTPIPLTEEWLLKLGGEKIPHFTISNSIIIKTKRNQQLSFGCVGTPNFMVFLQELDPDNENKITDLIPIHNWDYDKDMYVHQLQNLFFTLSGKELTKTK
ncbi:hypothetical protein HZQ94_08910 [Elizabethkingia anophelis]|nr:hypothetical protein [Elizabethkingia anophelis]MCT3680144.1 hypothetical protein [Elizabethkingia anophelis]